LRESSDGYGWWQTPTMGKICYGWWQTPTMGKILDFYVVVGCLSPTNRNRGNGYFTPCLVFRVPNILVARILLWEMFLSSFLQGRKYVAIIVV